MLLVLGNMSCEDSFSEKSKKTFFSSNPRGNSHPFLEEIEILNGQVGQLLIIVNLMNGSSYLKN